MTDFTSRLNEDGQRRLEGFVASANKVGLHPLDWDRFYTFVGTCDHAVRPNVNGSLLKEYLKQRKFDSNVAEDVGDAFDHLLRFMDLTGGLWEK